MQDLPKLRVTKPDGAIVLLDPHVVGGQADPSQMPLHILRRKVNYQQGIIDRVNQWGLWRYIDEPGRMTSEYRRLWREDPKLQHYVNLARRNIEDMVGGLGFSDFPEDYLLPGTIWYGHSINADFLIDRELESVFMYALTNTSSRPIDLSLPPGAGGNVRILPGSSLPLLFQADKYINPRPSGSPLLFEPYRHYDPQHNIRLSPRGGMKSWNTFVAPKVIDNVVDDNASSGNSDADDRAVYSSPGYDFSSNRDDIGGVGIDSKEHKVKEVEHGSVKKR